MARLAVRLLLLLSLAALYMGRSSAQQTQADQQAQASTPSSAPASQTQGEANSRIQRSVDDVLQGDQILRSADITTTVDDVNITLSGTVETYAQHQRAMDIVQQYSRYRRIVDKIKVGQ